MSKHPSRIKEARALLSKHPGRTSKPRLQLLAFMLQQHGPVTHAEIQRELPDLDRVSIYRNLDWLVDKGILGQLVGEDGLRRYASSHEHHDHSMHPISNAVNAALPVVCMTSTLSEPALPEGYQVENCSMILAGTCPSCQTA